MVKTVKNNRPLILWARVGDSGVYTSYDDLSQAAFGIRDDGVTGRVDTWQTGPDGHGAGISTASHSGQDYVSLYWGDRKCQYERGLYARERKAFESEFNLLDMIAMTVTNVRPTGDYEEDLYTAIAEHDHPKCTNNTCDIDAAIRNGYVHVAAHLLGGATETPSVDAVNERYADYPPAKKFFNRKSKVPIGWDAWAKWFKRHARQCDNCESFVFDDLGNDHLCGNCAKPTGVKHAN